MWEVVDIRGYVNVAMGDDNVVEMYLRRRLAILSSSNCTAGLCALLYVRSLSLWIRVQVVGCWGWWYHLD
jgi:hypothetical protein